MRQASRTRTEDKVVVNSRSTRLQNAPLGSGGSVMGYAGVTRGEENPLPQGGGQGGAVPIGKRPPLLEHQHMRRDQDETDAAVHEVAVAAGKGDGRNGSGRRPEPSGNGAI